MPEDHPPRQSEIYTALWSKSMLKIVLEVVLISAGVFLGLMGEQWRETREHRALAEQSLRRFRTEILSNQKAVLEVKDYHRSVRKTLNAYARDPKTLTKAVVEMKGLNPALFEQSAWELALVTQSLVDIDQDLAFALSRIYNIQREYAELTHQIMLATFIRTPAKDLEGFFGSVAMYFGDLEETEPLLLGLYDKALPQIDRALGEATADQPAAK